MLAFANARAADSAAEISVKAAIAHKIVKFVAWPESRFESQDIPLRFCVLGDDRFLEAFENLSDRPIHGRSMLVTRPPEPSTVARNCDVLYLADDSQRSASEWLQKVVDQPVLTFGEAGEYGGEGSIVTIAIRRHKVRFSIDLEANENTGLRISAQLLQLAASVAVAGR